jgi:hypothetical protein
MSTPLSAILLMLAAWALLFPAICGLGFATLMGCHAGNRSAVQKESRPGPATAFWFGLALLLLILPAIHLVAKIDGKVTYPLLALGYASFIARLWRQPRFFSRSVVTDIVLALPGLMWLAAGACQPPTVYDSGLYHFSAIRWASEYPVVPGLGNLHGRLAFNQSFFLYTALWEAPPFTGRGFHLANSLPFVVLFVQLIGGARMVFIRRQARLEAWFCATFLPVVAIHGAPWFRANLLSSPTPDLMVFILGTVLMLQVAILAQRPALARRQRSRLHLIVFLSIAGIVTKLSFLAAGAVCLSGALWLAVRSGWLATDRRVLAFVTVAGIFWCVHGVLTSGYPLYPSPTLGLPVDWKIPRESAVAMTQDVKSWARRPGDDFRSSLHGWDWVGAWAERSLRQPESRLLLGFLAGALVCTTLASCSIFRRRTPPLGRPTTFIPIVPGVAGLAFCWITAPDPRFLGAPPLAAAAWLFSLTLWRLRGMFPGSGLAIAASVATCLVMAAETGLPPRGKADAWGWGRPVKVETITQATASGLSIRMPAAGPQLWDAKLPSTPYLDPRLELRGTKLRQGFRLHDGSR